MHGTNHHTWVCVIGDRCMYSDVLGHVHRPRCVLLWRWIEWIWHQHDLWMLVLTNLSDVARLRLCYITQVHHLSPLGTVFNPPLTFLFSVSIRTQYYRSNLVNNMYYNNSLNQIPCEKKFNRASPIHSILFISHYLFITDNVFIPIIYRFVFPT